MTKLNSDIAPLRNSSVKNIVWLYNEEQFTLIDGELHRGVNIFLCDSSWATRHAWRVHDHASFYWVPVPHVHVPGGLDVWKDDKDGSK